MIISRVFEEMTLREVKMMASGLWNEVDRHWDDHIIIIDTQGNDEAIDEV